MTADPFVQFKAIQREGWALFAPLEMLTIPAAGDLVDFAGVKKGQRVLDVGCGTGVVAVTAARKNAQVSALDLSPVLLARAVENAALAQVEIDFKEGDVEALPYRDGEFDCVLSQFGHMFAPRPQIAITEMLRVLKPGGTIAFNTWPPELFTGKMFSLVGKYLPLPEGVSPPPLWGDPAFVRQQLGEKVTEVVFDRQVLISPVLSIQHLIQKFETTAAPVVKLKEKLKVEDPKALEQFRSELASLICLYTERNTLRQHFLMSKAVKR